ncbi:hypothetical protein [Bradyrhizobium sp.]|uniref:hypothetical protein n=1 Tax=Bradyrhizobium sp. TaxID=376 RepID=UPI0026124FF7|nr:hypothetical protein [Bradyrhizobium sp.]
MARVIRLFWRLDYEPSYAFMDRRGTALQILKDHVEGYWQQVADGTIQTSFVGKSSSPEHARQLSLEPTSMNGSMDWPAGLEVGRVLESPEFRKLDRLVKALIDHCEIRLLKRAGVRTFSVEQLSPRADARETIVASISSGMRRVIEEKIGKINDLAYVFEGKGDDDLGYRVQFGPYEKKNAEMTLQRQLTEEEAKVLSGNDLFFDIDLFENNISFAEHSLGRWARTKLEKTSDLLRSYQQFQKLSA